MVVHVDFAIHFLDIHSKPVGVVVHQIQFDLRLVKSQFVHLDIPHFAVFERLWRWAGKGGAEANQQGNSGCPIHAPKKPIRAQMAEPSVEINHTFALTSLVA